MIHILSLTFALPFVAGTFYFALKDMDKVKFKWLATWLLYAAIYLAVFHLWLKDF